jgi:hypothetical protein
MDIIDGADPGGHAEKQPSRLEDAGERKEKERETLLPFNKILSVCPIFLHLRSIVS